MTAIRKVKKKPNALSPNLYSESKGTGSIIIRIKIVIQLNPCSLNTPHPINAKTEYIIMKGVDMIPSIFKIELSIPSEKHCFKAIIDKIRYKPIENFPTVLFTIPLIHCFLLAYREITD